MATRRSPSLPSATELRNYSGPAHPVVSAVQFSELTRNTGGATMNAHTNEIAKTGSEGAGYAVGGARDMSKARPRRVPTKSIPITAKARNGRPVADLPITTVLAERDRIRRTGRNDPGRSLGSWDARKSDEPRSVVDIDASDVIHDRQKAVALGQARGEDAVFDLHKLEDVSTMKTRKRGKKL